MGNRQGQVMVESGGEYCEDCDYLLCCQVWNRISWQCTKGERRRELKLDGLQPIRRRSCVREGWYEPREGAS